MTGIRGPIIEISSATQKITSANNAKVSFGNAILLIG
jgi:hypothetical protein